METTLEAFHRTRLHDYLSGLGVSTIVVAGCNFPNCPRATIYDSSAHDYRVLVPSDAVSGDHRDASGRAGRDRRPARQHGHHHRRTGPAAGQVGARQGRVHPTEQVEALRTAAATAPVDTAIVRYADAQHGFHCAACTIADDDGHNFDRTEFTHDGKTRAVCRSGTGAWM